MLMRKWRKRLEFVLTESGEIFRAVLSKSFFIAEQRIMKSIKIRFSQFCCGKDGRILSD